MKNLLIYFGSVCDFVNIEWSKAILDFCNELTKQGINVYYIAQAQNKLKNTNPNINQIYIDDFKTWDELRAQYKNIFKNHKIDSILISGMNVNSSYRINNEEKLKNVLDETFENNKKFFNFDQTRKYLTTLVPFYNVVENINIYHYIDDPQSPDFSKIFKN